MGRRKAASRVDDDHQGTSETVGRIVSSLLELSGTREPRKELIDSLSKLSGALQKPPTTLEFSPPSHRLFLEQLEGEWLHRVEEAATEVRERCEEFLEDLDIAFDQIHALCRKLADHSTTQLNSENQTSSLDSTRILLASRSLTISSRLQKQLDEQVVDAIILFLSSLYVDCENISGAGAAGEEWNDSSVVEQINRWMESLENQRVFQGAQWLESFQELENYDRSAILGKDFCGSILSARIRTSERWQCI